ncbi:MAG: thioredoxin domain-containing protein [Gammaproteobacteria bacterium]|nr:MAG: thioredoxin domain-containing protein [Gammaproteobacteria bacterium]
MSTTNHRASNRLIHESSPYLLQHAHNPVQWYPWGNEALTRARKENKPILLSIGYSACHWCHVMEHESFESDATAEVMNALFINIKVDREERPDLDKIYQTAHQMLTQRPGGWPLNMFLSPEDHVPIFGGTYFPKEPRHGMPPFTEVCRRVAEFYRDQKAELNKQSDAIRQAFVHMRQNPVTMAQADTQTILARARQDIGNNVDADYGGFGKAPKFFHTPNLEYLLRHWAYNKEQPDDDALNIVNHSLSVMAQAGIVDQLGGGFYRYSVDDYWMIPHFEKMLYDNGQLLALYADAFHATGNKLYRYTAQGIADWVMREMQHGQGGYYSSLDADSEGKEGRFYTWSNDEMQALLTDNEWQAMQTRYALQRPANFEGRRHLHIMAEDLDSIKITFDHPELQRAQAKLFHHRQSRIHPGRDDKILTSWNALMILGMARGGRILDQAAYIESADRALQHIQTTLWKDGRLLVTAKNSQAKLNAYLDDYAYLLDALLELLQCRWSSEDLRFAIELAEVLLDHFEDKKAGGFFFTSDDHEALMHRPKPDADDAMPSGNSIAALGLQRLGWLLGETRYLDAAERTLTMLATPATHNLSAYGSYVMALQEYHSPPQIVILRGRSDALSAWREVCTNHYAPGRMVFTIAGNTNALPPALAAKTNRAEVTAYICSGMQCDQAIMDREALNAALGEL